MSGRSSAGCTGRCTSSSAGKPPAAAPPWCRRPSSMSRLMSRRRSTSGAVPRRIKFCETKPPRALPRGGAADWCFCHQALLRRNRHVHDGSSGHPARVSERQHVAQPPDTAPQGHEDVPQSQPPRRKPCLQSRESGSIPHSPTLDTLPSPTNQLTMPSGPEQAHMFFCETNPKVTRPAGPQMSPLRQTIALATVLSLTRRCLAMATLERPS